MLLCSMIQDCSQADQVCHVLGHSKSCGFHAGWSHFGHLSLNQARIASRATAWWNTANGQLIASFGSVASLFPSWSFSQCPVIPWFSFQICSLEFVDALTWTRSNQRSGKEDSVATFPKSIQSACLLTLSIVSRFDLRADVDYEQLAWDLLSY